MKKQKHNSRSKIRIGRKELAKKKLKSYQLRSILVLTGGIIISALLQYLINNDINSIIGPISWPAIIAITITTFMAMAIYVKAYSFYLYSRLFDLLSTITTPVTEYGKERELAAVQPTALQTVRPAPEVTKPRPRPTKSPSIPAVPREVSARTSGKICPYCGRELPLGDIHVFCPFCGKKLK